jgi:hypothetical protein
MIIKFRTASTYGDESKHAGFWLRNEKERNLGNDGRVKKKELID